MYNFMRQFETKDEKSLVGKIFSPFKKRDGKAKEKMAYIYEEPASDFDY
jgi:hypothetical protein